MHWETENFFGKLLGDRKRSEVQREFGIGRLPMGWDRVVHISLDSQLGEG